MKWLTVSLPSLVFVLFNSFNSTASEFVGADACIDCHQAEYQAWLGSHHERSMQHASDDSVLANFNNQRLVDKGAENKFFRKGDEFWVNIKGADGKFHDYQIKYTFAYEPLQQYMVEFNDGRVQLIPFAWDSRTKEQGGQRWFNLYPEFDQPHQEYFWTNTGQNWNYMCADCHSTDLKKNFDVKANRYNTTFKEINVACEACHGPASEHITWSKSNKTINKPTNKAMGNRAGFERNLSKAVPNWVIRKDSNTLFASEIKPTDQTLVCAQCHSRHVQISDDDHVKANDFSQRHMLNLLTPNMYYPDGRIYDEVFVYGSFIQSKMYQNGVVCSNCHDPHTAELIMPEEVVCLQCHQAPSYATKEHHHHEENSTGAQCVNCHMPEENYMKVDDRRDHGWHSPRPDLSNNIGTPDTCLNCHEDKNSQWSESYTHQWYPKQSEQTPHFSQVFAAADANYQGAAAELSKIAQNNAYPEIIRAAALSRMDNLADTNTLIAIARTAKSDNSLIKLGAINGAQGLRAKERWRILSPLLSDEVLAVRTESAFALAPLWQELSKNQQQQLQPVIEEFLQVQKFNNDRGFSHTNSGNVLAYQQHYQQAEAAYKQSIKIEPYFATAYINMAELYRLQNLNQQALATLENATKLIPDNGELYFSLGLAYIREKSSKAHNAFAQATQFSPQNAHYFYIYGLSLEKINLVKAYHELETAYQLSNNPQHLYVLCDMQVRHRAQQAKQCLTRLQSVVPANVVETLSKQLSR